MLGENTFTENVGMKGIVLVEATKQKDYPMIIVGNTFTYNSGFLFSDTLYLQVTTDSIYNPDLVEADHYCGGIYFASNTFSYNIGCGASTPNSVLAYCYSANAPSVGFYTKNEYLDHQELISQAPSEADQIKFLSSVDPNSFAENNYTYSYGGTYGTLTFNMEKVIVKDSTFTNNYAGNNGGVLKLEGFPYLEISNLNFQNNANNIPDFAYLYSSIVKYVQTANSTSGLFRLNTINFSYMSTYAYKMHAPLYIDMGNQMSMSNLVFTNNWVIDHGTSHGAGHAIKIRNVYKAFNCLNCQFTQNKGIANDEVLNQAANQVNFANIDKGITKQIIGIQH